MSRNFQPNRNNVKKQPVKPQNLKLTLALPEGTSENVINDILEVLAQERFDKISHPVGTYRYLLDNAVPKDDTRVLTVGYIKDYDPEKEEFTVVIYAQNRDLIFGFKDPGLEIVFNTYNDALTVITKFNVIPLDVDEETAYQTTDPKENETEPVE